MENKANEAKSEFAKREEEILKFWQDNDIFKKSEDKLAEEEFVFYDGPPFATGLPHYGHLLAGTMKDTIPRYQTMKGKRVVRRWGWDCHGLPMENIIEAELGLKTKKDILDFGIGKFNEAARKAVLRYAGDWQEIVPRLGRWVDMVNAYKTMDASYTESVWWIFKTLYDKGLIYEGYKAMQICPRCETTLSNFEVNQGYKDVKDLAVTVKMELMDQPGTFLLAWTTTPWTLPGNVALAINPEIDYVTVVKDGQTFIVAEAMVKNIFGEEIEITEKIPGADLIGKKYKTLFDYYLAEGQVYGADFVTTEDGTGIVHIAPAFGSDDYELLKRENLPFIQHVGMDGRFKPEVKDWAGRLVKPKDNPEEIDVEIIKYLASKNLLFAKEKITHSYPHCWRCDTPLLNYATSSWFVKVTEFKDDLVAANNQINWVPEHIKDGRFGKWLLGARDWAISRSRFWGAPLPVWKCEGCKETKVIGTLEDLKQELPLAKNNYWAIRHGLATSNIENRVSSKVENDDHLTPEGREQVEKSVQELASQKIDLIISSDFIRTKETAEILAKGLGLGSDQIIFDPRLREIDAGELEGKDWSQYGAFFKHHVHELNQPLPGGESLAMVRERVVAALLDLEKKYENKNILLVSHGLPIFSLLAGAAGVPDEHLALLKTTVAAIKHAEPYEVKLDLFPRNETGGLDLHRPFIDDIKLKCACGGEMVRVPEVFDCWFESGAMPYGQNNYVGQAKPDFDPEKNVRFPAEFIAEGLDQTRGWFYSMLVLGVALFNKSPYKNVIVNGLVLAEDGQKMSKKLRNYPDPLEVVDKYGADALRFYLLSAPVVRAEDLNFSETGVAEVGRKIVARLMNVLNFYQTYSGFGDDTRGAKEQKNVLDIWIKSRLSQTTERVGQALDKYELDRATRELDSLIDDFSNWFLRRSRERFKSDDLADREAAITTTKQVLRETAKLLAPFTPFMAEQIFQTLKRADDPESVHLTAWPEVGGIDDQVLESMKKVRGAVEFVLGARNANEINVRQPLPELRLSSEMEIPEVYLEILKQETNIKKITFISDVGKPSDDDQDWFKILKWGEAFIGLNLSPELKFEGNIRELTRQIQELRKKTDLKPSDFIKLTLDIDSKMIDQLTKFIPEIKKAVNAKEIIYGKGDSFEVNFGDISIQLDIDKI